MELRSVILRSVEVDDEDKRWRVDGKRKGMGGEYESLKVKEKRIK